MPDPAPETRAQRLNFFVLGDSGQETPVRDDNQRALADWSQAVRPWFLVLAGDNFYPSGVDSVRDPGWKTHIQDVFADIDLPIYPCLGNHDHQGAPDAQVAYTREVDWWRLPARFHSFAYGFGEGASAEFFVLDSQALRTDIRLPFRHAQVRWLERALESSRANWKCVVAHHPLLSGGPKASSRKLGQRLQSVLRTRGVDLYLAGHNHTLELLDSGAGWLQLVSGAFAAPDPVRALPSTIACHDGGGFAWVSLGVSDVEVHFVGSSGELRGSHRLERSVT